MCIQKCLNDWLIIKKDRVEAGKLHTKKRAEEPTGREDRDIDRSNRIVHRREGKLELEFGIQISRDCQVF